MFVVLDTNVLVSALCSPTGASFALVQALPSPKFTPVMSQTLWTEYQDLVHRSNVIPATVSTATRQSFCDLVMVNARLHSIHYRWRTQLPDPGDAHVLELAVAGQAEYIVTHNISDFRQADSLGVTAIKPGDFIKTIGGLP